MANNYILFAELIECPSADAAAWLENQLEDTCQVERSRDPRHLYIWTDDGVDLEELIGVLSEYQTMHAITTPISVQWAETCSKPRPGEFGGGAVVVCKGMAYWFNTADWVREKVYHVYGSSTDAKPVDPKLGQ